jgi:cell division protein FtsB
MDARNFIAHSTGHRYRNVKGSSMMRQSGFIRNIMIAGLFLAQPAMAQHVVGHPDAAAPQPTPDAATTPRERALEVILQNTRMQLDGQVISVIQAGDQIKQMQTTAGAQATSVSELTADKDKLTAQVNDLTTKLAAAEKSLSNEQMTNHGLTKARDMLQQEVDGMKASTTIPGGGGGRPPK